MIGFLKGILEIREDPHIFINVSGVGYKVLASASVLSQIKTTGVSLQVYTYTHVREDILELYGFSSREDLRLFELLITVSGIGPKTAIGIFSVGTSGQIREAIIKGDVDFFTLVPRLGRKNAQKIIIELKNKVGGLTELDLSGNGITKDKDEIVSALKTFGFTTSEIHTAIREVKGEGTIEERIKLVLKYLGSK